MSSTMPMRTTWSPAFATDEQFAKTFKGSLANMCRRQDQYYEDEDYEEEDDCWLQNFEKHQSRPYSISSTLHNFNDKTPPSDATVFSEQCKFTLEVTGGMTPEPLNPTYKFPPPTVEKVSIEEPVTPGTFRESRSDETYSLRKRVVPNMRMSTFTKVETQQGEQAHLVRGNHRTSLSPFVRTWIYRTKTVNINLDDECPPLYMKAPRYVISELQELGLQPTTTDP